MTFTSEIDIARRVPVIRCYGSMVFGEDTSVLDQHVGNALIQSRRCILNLNGVRRLDAHGIGVLVRLHGMATALNGSLGVEAIDPRHRELLGRTGLWQVLSSAASDEQTGPTVPSSTEPEQASQASEATASSWPCSRAAYSRAV